jgi:integrase
VNRVSGHVRLAKGKRGDTWYLKYRLGDGRQVQRKLGPAWAERSRPPAGYFTRRTAEEALQAVLTDARRGTIAIESGTGHTFRDACEEWLRYSRDEKDLAESTLRDYRSTVECHLYPEFGEDLPLAKITTERIDAFREKLLDDGGLSRRTIQKLLVLLHGILARAKRRKWIASNPAEDAERVAVRRTGDFNVLTPAEVAATARAASTDTASAFITVAAFSGLRLGELRGLRWADVDFGRSWIFVRRNVPTGGVEKAPKSNKVRSVPLIDQAAVALDALSRREEFTGPDDRVFPSVTGGPIDGKEMRSEFYSALERAGLGHLREKDDPMVFHDLRHTFGTLAASIWPLADVKAFMGHADIQTTMIYVHHVPKTTAAAELSRAVEAAMSPDLSPTPGNRLQLSATEEN